MLKRRKRMCATCIYRTGELKRYRVKHPCHEHVVGGIVDETVACAGSCRAKGMELIDIPTPNRKKWSKNLGIDAMCLAIERLLDKGYGKRKMSDSARLHKVSKGKINHIV